MLHPGADGTALPEGNKKVPPRAMVPETQAGFLGTAWFETEMSGTWEIQQYLDLIIEYVDRMGLTLRKTDVLLEVGPADSTLSAGKLRTWGSGGTKVDLVERHIDHTQRWSSDANKT